MLELNKIHNMDALTGMKLLDDDSIDCIVTSPPYWGLRDYGVDGQLGLEKTFQEYIEKLVAIFTECKRVLKPTGTCWVNIGSSYSPGKDDTMELRNDLSQEDKLYVLTELAKCNLL